MAKQKSADEKALLAAVCADPEDDTVRLAYADWLDERGDPASTDRAAFIRVQIEAARELTTLTGFARVDEEEGQLWDEADRRRYGYSPPTVRVGRRKPQPVPPTAWDRGQELQDRYEEQWLGPFLVWLRRYSDSSMEGVYVGFRRGFLHRFTMTVEGFRKHAKNVFASAPVRELWFPELGDQYGRLADCTQLARVRSLDLRDAHTTPGEWGGYEELLVSPHLSELRVLTAEAAGESGPEPPGLRALLGKHHLRKLETLTVASPTDEFVRSFAAVAAFPRLTTLRIPQGIVQPETARALAEARGLPALNLLDLWGATVTPRAKKTLEDRFGTGVRFKRA